ncbi:emp24/gp25L/p24 family protein (macronuclear) [Tetrahymena thermophila SB210]|uniref:Emp24/gp25L/p24 family protein n=1 Tax=Tetrahymena thermophila (strain SB210) TaxID=312017 RepID=Q23Q61_TETTS|nr:emp24/gp25L/p24 family protein [Tetrahymena thermophila SB210]EAR98723.1 emp24/gp25L/p24 family protein [Tetrahymena thermophila SB210]|eukprot:XP_001018968.1 emp24/gp25L/p24 family protein [Tetrahymena thermophila SB210]
MKSNQFILILALAVGTISCLDLNIGNRMPHCFYLDLAAKETVNIQYEVTGYKAQEFRMTIYDASKLNEQPVHTTEKEKSTTYSLWSQEPKEYKVCFQSLDSSGKILQFEFIRGEKMDESFVNDKTLEKTFDILQDAQYQLNVIYSNLRHQLMKTDMQAQILESTENKVKWCSVIKMVLMISITTIQIVFLTGLFKDSTPFGI